MPASPPVGSAPERVAPATPRWRRDGRRAAVGAALVALLVPVVVAGGLVDLPLQERGWQVPVYGAVLLVACLCLDRRYWRSAVPWAFLGFWIVLAVWLPVALDRAPQRRLALREIDALLRAGAFSLAALCAVGGRRIGVRGLRLGWVLGLAVSCLVGLWEVTTRDHLWVGPSTPWPFTDRLIVAGTFINPNNLAAAHVAMIAGCIAFAARTPSRALRRLVWLLVAVGALFVFTSGSRTALAVLAVVAAMEGWRRLRLRQDRAGVARLRDLLRPHAAALAAGACAVVAVVAALTAVPPTVMVRNPVRRLVLGAFDPTTNTSDELRADLIAAALRYLRESHYLGSGAGSFEPLLAADPHPGVSKVTNLHNTFVELLSQYGVVVGAAFALAVVVVLAALTRAATTAARLSPAQRDERRVTVFEVCGYLLSFVAFGVSASSALSYPTWWLTFASAATVTWWLSADGAAEPPASARERAHQAHHAPGP